MQKNARNSKLSSGSAASKVWCQELCLPGSGWEGCSHPAQGAGDPSTRGLPADGSSQPPQYLKHEPTTGGHGHLERAWNTKEKGKDKQVERNDPGGKKYFKG